MRLALLVTLLLLCGPALAAPQIVFRTGHTHGVFRFVEAITGGRQASSILADRFRGSRYDTPRLRALADTYRRIREQHCGHSYRFNGYPSARQEMGWDIHQALNLQSALARDLDDLAGRTAQLLPPAEHRQLLEILRAFEPAYDALVWRPSRAKLERYRRRLAAMARKARLGQLFDRVARFYRSHWPDSVPLTVVLHPIPAARGHTTAYVIANVAPVEALLDEKDLAGRLAVVFHELCHALYESQPAEVQQELHKAFSAHRSPYTGQAYTLLNEALATALGNGWSYKQITGRLDPDRWYNDPQIDGYAHAIYPRLTAYLEAGRPLDRAFFAQAVAAYRERFPDAIYTLDNLLKEVFVAAEGKLLPVSAIGHAVRRHFRVPSMYRQSPLAHPQTVRSLGRLERQTAVLLVFFPGEEQQLAQLVRRVPALARRLPELRRRKGAWICSLLDGDHRPWILMRLTRSDQLEPAVAALKRQGQIRADRPFLAL
jgi:hypothetical protein